MGDFQCGIVQILPQSGHLAAHQAQAWVFAVFKAAVKKQLHAQTDPQKGFAGGFLPQHRNKTGGVQLGFGVGKGADTGQNDPVGGAQTVGLSGNFCREPQGFQAGAQGEEVSHAVIHNCNHGLPPFVTACPWCWGFPRHGHSPVPRPSSGCGLRP